MPKAQINESSSSPISGGSSSNRTPVKINAEGTPKWYLVVMFALMLLGLLYLVVNYLAGEQISFMQELGPWNYGIGFGLFIIGLLMTMGWK
ncbi:cell division protein CrgA [Corynebacterium incognita]|uniref:Cell division protein CrgA n=1 Tax=Corynebacterium incognita TaxID=2754725 RepID=A0A7G7CM26_9CORY|nr:cell division protein CrgA [Corynebacterium incognita]QNE88642.1 cell division protein CrgA [Corynebacterium incognita]